MPSASAASGSAKTEKVTDQGSGPAVVPVLLPLLVKTPVLNTLFPVIARSLSRICHFAWPESVTLSQ